MDMTKTWPNIQDENVDLTQLGISGNPTLCEINYDPGGYANGKGGDEVVTPYRCRSRRSRSAHPEKYREQLRSTFTSLSFYEPITMGYRTPVNSFAGGTRPNTTVSYYSALQGPGGSVHRISDQNGYGPHALQRGQLTTSMILPDHLQAEQGPKFENENPLVTVNQQAKGDKSTEGQKNKNRFMRAKTAPSLPSVNQRTTANQASYQDHLLTLSTMTVNEEVEGEEKLVWVEALNTWVPEKQYGNQHPLPYLNFVNAMNLMNRGMSQSLVHDGENSPLLPCQRFLSHMQMKEELAKTRALEKQQRLEEEKRKRLERAAQMRHFRNHLKSSQSAPITRHKSRVRFEPPKPPVRQPVSRRPEPPSSPDSGLDEDTQSMQDVAPPVYLTEPLSDDDIDQVDQALDLEPPKSPTPPPIEPPPKSPTPPPAPSPPPPKQVSPTPQTVKVTKPEQKPPATPKKKVTITPTPIPHTTFPHKPLLPAIKTMDQVIEEEEEEVLTRKVSPPRVKKLPAKVKKKVHKKVVKEPPVEELPTRESSAITRNSSAMSKVETSDQPQLQLIVRSEQPQNHPFNKIHENSNSRQVRQPIQEVDSATESSLEEDEERVIEEPFVKKPQPILKKAEKKDRWRAEYKPKEKPELPPVTPEGPQFRKKRTGDWIFDDDDFSTPMPEKQDNNKGSNKIVIEAPDLPKSFPMLTVTTIKPIPRPQSKVSKVPPTPTDKGTERQKRTGTFLQPGKAVPDWAKNKWGQKQRDTSLADELERERLAEERRARAQAMLDKMRGKQIDMDIEDNMDGANMDDYGWLAKYCILPKSLEEAYKKTFEAVDEDGKGWLSPVDTILALRASNHSMTDAQEEYIYRILQLTGYSITDGSDMRLFCILAALSQKISALDEWMQSVMASVDLRLLEMKLFMCKTLWECNVDPETNSIPIAQLCVELRAGGVSLAHELEVKERLKHLKELDLLDFLTYIPLFIMLHESIVDNPLDDKRDK